MAIALQGFSKVKLFPVTQNDAAGYTVSDGFDVPEAQELVRDADTTESKIYADDRLYLNAKSWNGIKATITFAEMSLEMMAKLGFGTFEDGTLDWNPQGEGKEFAMSFRCRRVDGKYRMYKMYSFKVDEIKESGAKTKGDGSNISTYQVIGMFTQRVIDGKPGAIKDSEAEADLDWLSDIE